MRAPLTLALVAVLVPTLATSQSPPANPEPEIGFRAGWARLSQEDPSGGGSETINTISIPGSSFFLGNGIHFTFFLAPQFALEPQLGYMRFSQSGESQSFTFLGLQPEYYLTAGAQRSAYFFGQIGMLRQHESFSGGSDSESRNIFGGGLGYRRVIREALAMRYEVRLRRIAEGDFDPAITEIGILIGVGAVIRRASP
jgi:hypothetical protein